tara:strand:+ start:238 stop:1341 length:1104 start_codon:yes stop_codon:yes gene_type:complete
MLGLFKNVNPIIFLKNLYFTQNEPVSLVHFVTNRCNARCSFCFIDFKNENIFNNELSLEEIDELTKTFGKSLINVNLTGGEPFARKDLVDIAKKYCENTSIQSIYITTNGSLPERIENFAKQITNEFEHITLSISISIDDILGSHDKIRKIPGLFKNCIESYNLIKNLSRVEPIINITVSHDNYDKIKDLYNNLINIQKIKSIKCTIVRDEGVYEIPVDKKKAILESYSWLTNQILLDSEKGILNNYNQKTAQGRLHYTKDKMSYDYVKKAYMKPFYQSHCPAGKLFGIIDAKGKVFACEILENEIIGNLRENNMNFLKVWNNQKNKKLRKFISETNCNCIYECALTYNFMSNFKYQYKFAKSYFDF